MSIAVNKAASRADRQHPTLYAAADTVKILAVSEEISLTAACETTRSNSKARFTFDLDDNGECKTVIFRWLYQFKDYVKHLKDWHDEEGDRDISGKTFLMK